jgi:hypothetical protein
MKLTTKFLLLVYVMTVVTWWLVFRSYFFFLNGTIEWWEIIDLLMEVVLGVFLIFVSVKFTLKYFNSERIERKMKNNEDV